MVAIKKAEFEHIFPESIEFIRIRNILKEFSTFLNQFSEFKHKTNDDKEFDIFFKQILEKGGEYAKFHRNLKEFVKFRYLVSF